MGNRTDPLNAQVIFYKHKAIICILLLCALFQLLFYSTFNYPSLESCHSGDAKTYVFPEQYAQKVLPRTPVYPVTIGIIKSFSLYENIPKNVVITQMIVFFVSIVFFFRLAELLLKNRRQVAVSTVIYGSLPAFLFYNRVIRVESLAISLFVIFLYFIISFVSSKKIVHGVLSSLFVVILVLLRPSFVFLLPCILLFWSMLCLRKQNIKKCWIGLLSAACSFFLILTYCFSNYVHYDDFSLTDISTYNQLVICYQSGVYEYGDNNGIICDLADGKSPHTVYMEHERKQVSSFIKSSYLSAPQKIVHYHLGNAQRLMPTSLFTLGGYKQAENMFFRPNAWGEFGQRLYAITSPFTFSFLILLLVFVFIHIVFEMMKSKRIMWNQTLLWACVFLQLFTGFLGAQAEYARMMVPVMPIVILWVFMYFRVERNDDEEWNDDK